MRYKYFLFEGANYEASGGMKDLRLQFDTYEEFQEKYKYRQSNDWYQLLNTSDFTLDEFSSAITETGYKDAHRRREKELYDWIFSNTK